MADKIRIYKKTNAKLQEKLNREPSDTEIAQAMDLSESKLQKIKQSVMLEPISLETAVTDDLCIGDYIEDKSSNSPDYCAKNLFLKQDIIQILEYLTDREKKVLIQRFGINECEQQTLAKLGNILGYSKERIRQIEEGALSKLRYNQNLRHLKDYIEN